MIPELTPLSVLTTARGEFAARLYYYTYSTSIIAGASSIAGERNIRSIGVFFLAVGIVMFGMGIAWVANVGRLWKAQARVRLCRCGLSGESRLSGAYLADCHPLYPVFGNAGLPGRAVSLSAPLVHVRSVESFGSIPGAVRSVIAGTQCSSSHRARIVPNHSKTSIWRMFALIK